MSRTFHRRPTQQWGLNRGSVRRWSRLDRLACPRITPRAERAALADVRRLEIALAHELQLDAYVRRLARDFGRRVAAGGW